MSPEASFFMVTLALGTAAPVASKVVPVRVPVSCWAKQTDASRKQQAKTFHSFCIAEELNDMVRLPEI
jgi:hypothetical protein